MAVYKIFPEKSATLFSYYPTTNTGLDEILEISTFESLQSTNEVSRGIIKFPTSELTDVINNEVSGSPFSASLKLYLADATSLPLNYTLYSYALSGSWDKGTGRLGDVPVVSDGASWKYRDQNSGSQWFVGSVVLGPTFPIGTTGSYNDTFGGGLWFTGSGASQSFTAATTKDINMDVSNTVKSWYNASYSNEGFIIKHAPSLEFTTASKFELKFFSNTTHTIYPPCLEIKWNDSTFSPGTLNIVTSSYYAAVINNNKGEFQQDSVQRFRVVVRDLYPPVVFRTTLSFANTKALPSSSYWSIKDLDTEETIVDYDTNFTKISCDASSNYFDVYMNGLEPERYYKLLVKAVLSNGEVVVTDKDYIFKVVR